MPENPSASPPGISVVIPNYNGADQLERNLPPLISALREAGADYEIIVSDDASADGSAGFLKKNYPGVILIENAANSGFSTNINRGIARASRPLTFLMNTDIRLEPGYFAPLLTYFSEPGVFGVMGRIVGMDDDRIQDSAKYPRRNGVQVDGSANYLPARGTRAPSLFLSGAEALVDTAKLRSLDGFDEIFSPFYGEDLDLGLRAWRSGWTCWYEHSAVCRHRTSSTIAAHNKPSAVRAIAARNKFHLHFIHLDAPSLALWLVLAAGNLVLKTLSLRFYYARGFALFLAEAGKALASRGRVPRGRTLRQAFGLVEKLIGEYGGKK